MSDEVVHSFGQQLTELLGFIRGSWPWPSPEAAFARYVFHSASETDPVIIEDECTWPNGDPSQQAPVLAVGGFLFSLGLMNVGSHHELWRNGFSRLAKRNAFPSDRQSFAYRPVELLGIALGAAQCPGVESADRTWLIDVIRRLEAEHGLGVWESVLYEVAAERIGATWNQSVNSQLEVLAPHEIALMKWAIEVYSQSHSGNSKGITVPVEAIDRHLLKRLGTSAYHPADVAQAALVYFALRCVVSQYIESEVNKDWQAGKQEGDARNLVVTLCRRFPLFAKHIRERRKEEGVARTTIEIHDEYDVQDAMFALLHLHFDDVRREEWTPSYAGTHSRMDFLLKKYKVVVEVKMTRKGLDQREVVRQLAVDKEHYRAHPDCQSLVCFVFDPAQLCTNPAALEADASEVAEKLSTTVIVAPKGL